MKAVVLCTDAYGGRGGIALYNRNFISAVADHPEMTEVMVVPRKVYYQVSNIPEKVTHWSLPAKNIIYYLLSIFYLCFSTRRIDIIFCTHLHLLPVAFFCKARFGCRIQLLIFGRDAWKKSNSALANFFAKKLNSFIAMRHYTAKRFIGWTGLEGTNYFHLPNCIDPSKYGVGPKDETLKNKFDLEGMKVIVTAGRLDDGDDLRKGFDEVLECLSIIQRQVPNIRYLIIGDGEDRKRLEKKALDLGVADVVRFTGYISEEDKPRYFRLGDVFAMPGSNPLFDRYPFRFVFLEALACGLKVIGSRLEDQWEINDPDSSVVIQVNPNSKQDISSAIIKALYEDQKEIHPRLENFYYENFKIKVRDIIDKTLLESRPMLD